MKIIVEQILRTMATDVDAKWVSKLSFVELTINLSMNTSVGKIPFELVYGQQVQNIIAQLDGLHRVEGVQQIVDNILMLVEQDKTKLLQAQKIQGKYYDKHHRPVKFSVNDKVPLSIENL